MQKERPSLAIVVPVYNEAESILRVMEELEAVARGTGLPYEIIFVDDGSDDRTPELLAQLDGLTVLHHATNRGYGAALKTGFDHARKADFIAFLDADFTYPPHELQRLLDFMQENPAATMCIGSRMDGHPNEMVFMRKVGNRLYAELCGVLFGSHLSDVCSGMRVFRPALFEEIRWSGFSDDLDFSPQLTSRCLRCGVHVVDLPIAYRERRGHSKLSVFHHGWRFLGSILRERFSLEDLAKKEPPGPRR